MRSKRRLTILFSVTISILILSSLFVFLRAGSIYGYQRFYNIDSHPRVDAIVCLAGARGRIEHAARIWNSYYLESQKNAFVNVPVLFVSGMGKKSNWNVFSSQVPEDILANLKQENVILENESEDTRQNAIEVEKRRAAEDWTRILLVTSSYHMKRAQLFFRSVLGDDVQVLSVALEQEPFSLRGWFSTGESIRITIIEYIKILLQRPTL